MLSKIQIQSCKHPRARLVYVCFSLFLWTVLALVIVASSQRIGVSDWLKKRAADTFTQSNAVNAQESMQVEDWVSAEKSNYSALLGVWHFDKGAPFRTLTLGHHDFLEVESVNPKVQYLSWDYANQHLLLEQFEEDAAESVLKVLALNVQVQPKQLRLQWGGRTYIGQRDLEASVPFVVDKAAEDWSGYYLDYEALEALAWVVDYWLPVLLALLFAGVWTVKLVAYSRFRAKGVRVSPTQYPKAFALFETMSQTIGLHKQPELYVVNEHGAYKSYSSCVPGLCKYMVISAEVFHAYETDQNEDALTFILARELGALRLGHAGFLKSVHTFVWRLIPYLGSYITYVYERGFAYEADRMSLHFLRAERGAQILLMFASSRLLYQQIDLPNYRLESANYINKVFSIENVLDKTPILPWRIDALCRAANAGLVFHKPAPDQMLSASAQKFFQAYTEEP
jgi:hypothetical protein